MQGLIRSKRGGEEGVVYVRFLFDAFTDAPLDVGEVDVATGFAVGVVAASERHGGTVAVRADGRNVRRAEVFAHRPDWVCCSN